MNAGGGIGWTLRSSRYHAQAVAGLSHYTERVEQNMVIHWDAHERKTMPTETISFVAYATPQPQGSMKGFVIPGKNGAKARAILTSDNTKLKPYRQEVTRSAMIALRDAGIQEPFAGKHVPVSLELDFYLARPDSVPKKRLFPVVRPDVSKLIRSTEDAMTGILYFDDSQIVCETANKYYGSPERVEIRVRVAATEAVKPVTEFEFSS